MENLTPERAQGLLTQLKATMADVSIWPQPVFDDGADIEAQEAAYKAEAKAAWNDLFQFSCAGWDNSMDAWQDTPELSGVDLCNRHWMFHSCPRENFVSSIRYVAAQDMNKDAAGFLYFMLGVMATSWRDYLAGLHGNNHA